MAEVQKLNIKNNFESTKQYAQSFMIYQIKIEKYGYT